MDVTLASIFTVIGTALGVSGKYALKFILNGKKDKSENGKAGDQSTIWWLEQNDKIVSRNMSPVVEALKELKEINSRMAEGITRLATIAEIKWK